MLAAMAPRIEAVTNVTYNTDGTAALKQQLTREKRDVIEESSVNATFRPARRQRPRPGASGKGEFSYARLRKRAWTGRGRPRNTTTVQAR